MNRLKCKDYAALIDSVCILDLPWEMLRDRTIAVSGATGMIGSFLIDVLMRKNEKGELNCSIVALGRSEEKAKNRLPYFGDRHFSFVQCDVSRVDVRSLRHADFVFHLASSTHPRAYSADPIGTIDGNVGGLRSLLDYSAECGARLLFASSVEIYGENRGDVDRFSEDYCGYIDCNTMRACYTESKRLCEAMCQAYISQEGSDVVIARIARVYGPTLLGDDTKALSQFVHRALIGEDVILKSEGAQYYSYLHVADVASGLLRVLLLGKRGEAYNLADSASDIRLKELAVLVAESGGVKVAFDLPDAQEAAGYSKATLALMDSTKAKEELGWSAAIPIAVGIPQTLKILSEIE